MSQRKYKIIISGGGTGGHIFPAVSIATAIKIEGFLVFEVIIYLIFMLATQIYKKLTIK